MAQPAHDYESAEFDVSVSLGHAIEETKHGKVIYLHSRQRREAVLMSPQLAEAALDALEAQDRAEEFEDAQDLYAARSAMARRESGEVGVVPHEEVLARFAADLEDQPGS